MAFDYGPRKIGVACGNTVINTASPLCVLPMQANAPDWQGINKNLQEWKPGLLIVGLPLNMDDTESALSTQAREFARALRNRYKIPVQMMDERLSTREAREQAAEAGYSKYAAVDALAAQRILSSWLSEPECGREP